MMKAEPATRMLPQSRRLLFVVCLAVMWLESCFVHHRRTPPPGNVANRPLLTASKQELINRIHRAFDPIHSFRMRADLSPAVGKLYGGELTEYATVRAYVLFLRPDDIRVLGLDPVLHSSTIFDMVSTGSEFRVYIPSKNRFVTGNNNAPPSSSKPLENMRPEAFLHSLIVEPPAEGDLTLLEDDTDESKAVYILFMAAGEPGQLHFTRAVYFDRYSLGIVRQKTFNPAGDIVSETGYGDWKPYGEISYPSVVTIQRPKEGYEVTMRVVEMTINPPDITSAKFSLPRPPGTQLTVLK
jgi:hypothetical protein